MIGEKNTASTQNDYILYMMEYYSALKMKEMLTCATMWMSLEDIMLSEMSKLQEDKSFMISTKSTTSTTGVAKVANFIKTESSMVGSRGLGEDKMRVVV